MSNGSHWSASISYDRFVVDSYVYLSDTLHQLRTDHRFPHQFWEDIVHVTGNNKDPLVFVYIIMLAFGWTMLRNAFTDYLVKPIAEKYELPASEQEKLPECAWKFIVFSSTWLLAAYILIVKEKGEPLFHPESLWNDCQFSKALPIEYHVLYVVQLSYYLHSIYATIAIDCWRKDSIVQLLHHMLAISLIFFGFSARAHQLGASVLFLHDICDVLLEGTKSALYFKTQGKRKYPIFELIGNVGFTLFALVWFCARLYVFPLRLIWLCLRNIQLPLSYMIFPMLYLLLAMNVYWFTFILRLMYKVTIGTDELNDLREYEEKTTELDGMSSDWSATVENRPLDSSDYLINKRDALESKKVGHYNLRNRSTHSS